MQLQKLFAQYKVESALASQLQTRLQAISLKKGEPFIHFNEKMNRLGILLQGLLISRFIDEQGNLIASKLYYPQADIIVVDYWSFQQQSSSDEAIEALADSLLYTLSYQAYQELLAAHPQFQQLVSHFAEQSYLNTLKRLRLLQTANAQLRIQKFLDQHGEVAPKLKVEDKASFLGMSRNSYTNQLKEL